MKCDKRRTPPAAFSRVVTVRTPCPIVVVIDPTAIVIWGPSPRLITNPRPAVWLAPGPIAMAVRRPIKIVVDDCYVGAPDPSVVLRVFPTAICVQFFCAPDVIVIVLIVVIQPLRQVAFAVVNPVVPSIVRRRR